MNSLVRITCLVDDAAGERSLPAEHGLSFLIEYRGRLILFDTGQTGLVIQNARQLGFDLAPADRIVLSHGHYDHTGGLQAVLQAAPRGVLFAHPAAFEPKYSSKNGQCRAIGMAISSTEAILRHGWSIVRTLSPTEVTSGLHVTGPIPRVTTFEDVGGHFYVDETCLQPDPLVDDQALYFTTREGVVILLGCAHAGIVNTLNYIHKLTRGTRIHAAIGGMHLLNASPDRLAATVTALQQFGVRLLAPCHCTGREAISLLRDRFPTQFRSCGVGTQFGFHSVSELPSSGSGKSDTQRRREGQKL